MPLPIPSRLEDLSNEDLLDIAWEPEFLDQATRSNVCCCSAWAGRISLWSPLVETANGSWTTSGPTADRERRGNMVSLFGGGIDDAKQARLGFKISTRWLDATPENLDLQCLRGALCGLRAAFASPRLRHLRSVDSGTDVLPIFRNHRPGTRVVAGSATWVRHSPR